MSKKYLGETFDIHAGAMDLKFPHHENEIAQSEAANGKKFVNYWVHPGLLEVEAKKMSKSLGNFIEIHEIKEKGFDTLSLRYLFLTVHYRDKLNFTWKGLSSAQTALNNLKDIVRSLREVGESEASISPVKLAKDAIKDRYSRNAGLDKYRSQFKEAIGNDLAIPKALAITWGMIKSDIPAPDKLDLLFDFDQVLGLKLGETEEIKETKMTKEIQKLVDNREKLRQAGKWQEADEVRQQIEQAGFTIEDTPNGPRCQAI